MLSTTAISFHSNYKIFYSGLHTLNKKPDLSRIFLKHQMSLLTFFNKLSPFKKNPDYRIPIKKKNESYWHKNESTHQILSLYIFSISSVEESFTALLITGKTAVASETEKI